HDPANAVANLDVHPELEATLFTHEDTGGKIDIDNGGLTNPTNLDIDAKGRIWVCDVMNYRGNNGKRPKGDRILIFEDTKGTGKADKMTVFYQGRDIDSAMGICVLGNKVIVSASPNVFVFTKDDNDKIIKKEVLFTKTGIPQHDHSAHSFVFGPDGRLYWNFGNTGGAVHDKNGKPVVDLAGNVVNNSGKPYRQGMVFRCDMDGGNFEVLGHNFRNNYEVCVDSFGTLWQSDNDDDGNRGVRINYVMEYGNFGYVDEMTGAGWQTKRTNMETEIPLRHWHLNDPGVVPNLLQTGQGSPTGICLYEGTLLPKVFQNQIIHCDAGPSIVRSYPVVPDGAGYKVTKTVNVLDGSKKNNWFRPADVCVAPDGSIFVTDWYDPGVGGHAQRDSNRGRIFRVAPKGSKYSVPKAKFDTIEDNIESLKSPNGATRYIAWTNLKKEGAKAEKALLKLFNESKVPHERARALWLLGQRDKQEFARLALKDSDPNIRIVGLRFTRQHGLGILLAVEALSNDPEPAVRRECAIALRRFSAPSSAALWARLASAYDGKDRWYLEALGISADKSWNRSLDAYMQGGPTRSHLSKPTRDIVWRSRADNTPTLLTTAIQMPQVPTDELPRLFRAFDFQKDSDIKTEALVKLAFSTDPDPKRQSFITSEAISRLKNFDVSKNPKYAAALDKVLEGKNETPMYVELVGKFNVVKRYPSLLAIAQNQPDKQLGIDAMKLLLERDAKLALPGLQHKQINAAIATVQAMGNAGHPNANPLLLPIVLDAKADLELRRQATRALGKTTPGAQELIKLAQAKKLAKELEIAAGSVLLTSSAKDIRAQAQKLFPQPTTKDNRPLPAISELVKMKGNVANGATIFVKQGTCAKCHQINGEGKNVGPDLSEIGKKLAREAILEAILYPSASIAHNYETYVVETKQGNTTSGLLVSKSDQEIVLKDAESIVRTFKVAEVDTLTRSPISLMPADLHQAMTTQELTDVVEYLLTLREARKKR
ncbi:MAG TPA: PVC-type heme-binding CxxCH protein, partial [Gemmataceae bacterium]|nr:PVC-type heme-binding CxxCH protein [Gemmataceae bacterium]